MMIYKYSNRERIKKHIDTANPDTFYSAIQDIFIAFGSPDGAADSKNRTKWPFLSSLAINVILRSRE
jgi:hypothetical protein